MRTTHKLTSAALFLAAVFGPLGVSRAADLPGPKAGEDAPAIDLKDLQGNAVSLTAMAKTSPVVVLFLRGYPGYQCPICTKQVGQFVAAAVQFKAAGAKVLMVYPGPADGLKAHADEFVTGKTMPDGYHLVIDPDYTAVNAWRLRWDKPNETAYPSTYVVGTDGKLKFAKSSTTHGGRAIADEVLAALKAK